MTADTQRSATQIATVNTGETPPHLKFWKATLLSSKGSLWSTDNLKTLTADSQDSRVAPCKTVVQAVETEPQESLKQAGLRSFEILHNT